MGGGAVWAGAGLGGAAVAGVGVVAGGAVTAGAVVASVELLLSVGAVAHPARQHATQVRRIPTGLNTPPLCGTGKGTQVVLAAS